MNTYILYGIVGLSLFILELFYFKIADKCNIIDKPNERSSHSEAVFEGVKAYIPNDYDTYLRSLYGDTYMQLPPMDKGERHFIVKLVIPE